MRIDQPVALAKQQLFAFDDHRQLCQRPGHAGNRLGQGCQFPLDGGRRNARRQQLGQTPGGGDFLKIEVGQTAHFAGRHDQAAAMPTADHGHRHLQQVGQHRGRVQPVNALLPLDQPQPLPQLGFGDHFQLAAGDAGSLGVVEHLVDDAAGRNLPVLADNHQVDRFVEPLDHGAGAGPHQLLGFAATHAFQAADKGHPAAGQPVVRQAIERGGRGPKSVGRRGHRRQ